MKSKIYHTVETVKIYCLKIVERVKFIALALC
jgi:hypothetical protein